MRDSPVDPAQANEPEETNEAATKGKATGLAEGLANLEATDPTTGIKATATLTVTAARLVRLQVDPPAATVPKGLTQDFTATGTYTDDTTQDLTGVVTWTSKEPTLATLEKLKF